MRFSSFRVVANFTSNYLPSAGRYFVLALLASILFGRTLNAQLSTPVAPVNVIIDSDMAHNADDTGDQAMMWALAAQGKVNVLAVIISSTNDYSAPVAHVIATYYGHPNIPIGANHSNIPDDYAAYFSYYTQQVAARFGNPSDTRANYPDAVTVYRQALAGAPDHSVYILSGGYYYPLAQLLQSSPDSISPLTGLQLVTQKVARLIIVAGMLPDSGTTDRGDMLIDPDNGSYVVAHWPGQLVWMPDDQAWNTYTGPGANANPNTNPIAYSYELYCNGGGSAPDQTYCANTTPAWAQLGELFTVFGLGNNFVVGGLNGSTVVWNSATSEPGRIIWSQSPNRNQSYLQLSTPGADLSSIIDPLIQWIPPTVGGGGSSSGVGTVSGTVTQVGGTVPLIGATVTLGSTSVLTDSNGRYSFTNVQIGSYTVTASYPGDQTVSQIVSVSSGTTSMADFSLATLTFTMRVKAGGTSFTDASGNVWQADIGYNGGYAYSTGATITSEAGDPRLYQSEHYNSGTLQYSFSNVPDGTYTVNLYFAEIANNCFYTGCRVFDVLVQGNTVLSSFDVYAAAGGGNIGIVRSATAVVSNGVLTITFQAPATQYPTISAIEILPSSGSTQYGIMSGSVLDGATAAPLAGATVSFGNLSTLTNSSGSYSFTNVQPGTYTVTVSDSGYQNTSQSVTVTAGGTTNTNFSLIASNYNLRVNAGGPSITDTNGNVWQADTGYDGGYVYSTTATITGTVGDQRLFQTEHYSSGNLNYTFTNVPDGTYTVNLYFAEIYSGCFFAGCRVFNVLVQGNSFLSNFDVYSAAGGGNIGIVRSTTATVTNGALTITLQAPYTQYPTISGIEVLRSH
ncbi:MAG TPA: malectin domain-containing carbohydrate-binding protein [Candidatus Sulfotelmatobacter sp.]|nr:malectin domain-containing carbohydrate-binding protein [Candidatus Sulfotelmatobacter sp.]